MCPQGYGYRTANGGAQQTCVFVCQEGGYYFVPGSAPPRCQPCSSFSDTAHGVLSYEEVSYACNPTGCAPGFGTTSSGNRIQCNRCPANFYTASLTSRKRFPVGRIESKLRALHLLEYVKPVPHVRPEPSSLVRPTTSVRVLLAQQVRV